MFVSLIVQRIIKSKKDFVTKMVDSNEAWKRRSDFDYRKMIEQINIERRKTEEKRDKWKAKIRKMKGRNK